MIIFYLVTTFVVLLVGAEATDKAISVAQHLPDQGAAASWEGCLASQRSGGLGTRCASGQCSRSSKPS
jgi:hypothetical protein